MLRASWRRNSEVTTPSPVLAGILTAVSSLSRPRLSGSIDGGNMKVIIAVGRFPSTPHATWYGRRVS